MYIITGTPFVLRIFFYVLSVGRNDGVTNQPTLKAIGTGGFTLRLLFKARSGHF